VNYNAVLKGLCMAKRWGDVEDLMEEMVRVDCPPNIVTFSTP
jgi:pentatricopeptide repeat protein